MTIIDALQFPIVGKPTQIPDCGRDDLPQFFLDMGYKVGAEIGVYKGEFSEKICKVGLRLYAIDPWREYDNFTNPRGQARLDFLYEHTKRMVTPYDCTVIRKTSMEALADIPDRSLDFVYIDGNHSFKYVAEDVAEWSKKVRVGGVVAGHDYVHAFDDFGHNTCDVIYIVQAYTQSQGIHNWYVLGRDEKVDGEKRDEFRSFMWIKK